MGTVGIVKGKEGRRRKKDQACFVSVMNEETKYFFPLQELRELKEEKSSTTERTHSTHSNLLTLYSIVCTTTVQYHTELMSCDNTTELSSFERT